MPRRWYSRGWISSEIKKRYGFYTEDLLPYLLSDQRPSPSLAIQRALSLSLYLANTGELEASRTACRFVIEIANKYGYELETYPHFNEIRAFVEEEQGGDSQMSGPDSDSSAQKALSREMKLWSNELCRNYPALDRSCWRDHADPLKVLRCASLFLVPSFDAPSASSSDELQALEALKLFLSLSYQQLPYASRRVEAMRYAIELSAKHDMESEAFELARSMTHESLLGFPDIRFAFILYPHFSAAVRRLSSFPEMYETREPLEAIWEGSFIDDVKLIPGRIAKHLEETLQREAKDTLSRMSIVRRLKTLERAARLAEHGVVLRTRASAGEIAKAEARIGYSLPNEYRELAKIANGWEGGAPNILPPLLPISSITSTTLPAPLCITSSKLKRNNPYSKTATFSTALLLSPSSYSSKIYLLRDVDLRLARSPTKSPSAKRVKGNDGQAVEHVQGDYRLVLAREGKDPLYFGTFVGLLNFGIRRFEKENGMKERSGVERSRSRSKLYTRPLPGENVPEENGDDDAATHVDPSTPKPACWYGTECRTQHHNPSHAARYDHTGLNTRTV